MVNLNMVNLNHTAKTSEVMLFRLRFPRFTRAKIKGASSTFSDLQPIGLLNRAIATDQPKSPAIPGFG